MDLRGLPRCLVIRLINAPGNSGRNGHLLPVGKKRQVLIHRFSVFVTLFFTHPHPGIRALPVICEKTSGFRSGWTSGRAEKSRVKMCPLIVAKPHIWASLVQLQVGGVVDSEETSALSSPVVSPGRYDLQWTPKVGVSFRTYFIIRRAYSLKWVGILHLVRSTSAILSSSTFFRGGDRRGTRKVMALRIRAPVSLLICVLL